MSARPWYETTLRWGQTNLTEIDPIRYDEAWWRAYWRETRVQGLIVNAGGIVAYYPSALPLHHRAEFLGDTDLYGRIVRAAREEHLTVVARMDSNRAGEDLYLEHPDWFAVDRDGIPYRAGNLAIACIAGPYYREFVPAILREIVERSAPDGFADNSWSGLDRGRICYCAHCRRRFRADTGRRLPARPDWTDQAYRVWIEWSYRLRTQVWELDDAVAREAGGPDCRWIGMNAGDLYAQSERLRATATLLRRAPIVFLDSQTRGAAGFHANTEAGLRLHALAGQRTLIPESTAMYDAGTPTFRIGSKPAPDARLWAVAGFAGGLQPWWHHIGALHEDRRQYATAPPLFTWHERWQAYLVDREPVAAVGVVWSQRSIDFYGRDRGRERAVLPYQGIVDALTRWRIPYVPVDIDAIADLEARDGLGTDRLAALVLPDLAAVSDAQVAAVRAYVRNGGSLIATGRTGRYDEWGEPREVCAWSDLLGIDHRDAHHGSIAGAAGSWEAYAGHSYLRLERARLEGARLADAATHALLAGFEDTDLLPAGGRLEVVDVADAADRPAGPSAVAATWVPPFPIYPPETSWPRRERSSLPVLTVREHPAGGRIAYLATDLDRSFARHHHPDHGRLLANLARWAAAADGGPLPFEVEGPGTVACQLFRQPERRTLVLHLVNLGHGGAWPGRVDELGSTGPLSARLRLPADADPARVRARLLVADRDAEGSCRDGIAVVPIPEVRDHEVVALGW